MTASAFLSLFLLTLRNPREAGELILDLRLPAQALWIGLSLVSVMTSLVFSGLMRVGPLPQDQFGEIMAGSPAYSAPLVFALMQWGRAVVTVFVFFWVGRMLGGRGPLENVLAVLTWLQAVTFVIMLGLLVAGLVLPFLTSLMILGAFAWWLWAVTALLKVAHGFEGIWRAIGVLILSLLGVTIGLSLFFGAVAGLFMGVS
jgi:hypothetical protein